MLLLVVLMVSGLVLYSSEVVLLKVLGSGLLLMFLGGWFLMFM